MIYSKTKNVPKYKKLGCGKTVYHSAQWVGGKIACQKCGIELSGNRKTRKYSWLIEEGDFGGR